MQNWAFLLDIVLLLGVALLMGILMERLRQNALIGYLFTGILVGPAGLGFVEGGPQVHLLAELGVALLLFTIGLEFSWSRLREFGAMTAVGGAAQIVVTLVAAMALMRLLDRPAAEALVVGAAVALSSTAVVLRVLSARAELDSQHGRNALGILLLQDLAVVPLLIIIGAASGGRTGWDAAAEFATRATLGLALVVALWLASRYLLPRLLHVASAFRNRDLPILLAITTALGGAWVSHALGLSPALGAFVSGMLLAESPFAEQIRADVVPLRAGFVTVFFASVGMLAAPPEAGGIALVAGMAALIMAGKALVVLVLLALLRYPFTVAAGTGLALAQIGEFSFVLLESASSGGLLPQESFQSLLAASLLTLLAAPYAIAAAPWLMERLGGKPWRTGASRHAEPGRVIVVGYGPAGQGVAAALQRAGISFLALELNPRTAQNFRGIAPVYIGDATQPEILEHAGVETARALVITIPDPRAARLIIRQARKLAPGLPVVVRARHHSLAPSLAQAGADRLVDEEELVGAELGRELLRLLKGAAASPD